VRSPASSAIRACALPRTVTLRNWCLCPFWLTHSRRAIEACPRGRFRNLLARRNCGMKASLSSSIRTGGALGGRLPGKPDVGCSRGWLPLSEVATPRPHFLTDTGARQTNSQTHMWSFLDLFVIGTTCFLHSVVIPYLVLPGVRSSPVYKPTSLALERGDP